MEDNVSQKWNHKVERNFFLLSFVHKTSKNLTTKICLLFLTVTKNRRKTRPTTILDQIIILFKLV